MTIYRLITAAFLSLLLACTPAENTATETADTTGTPPTPEQPQVHKNTNAFVAAVEEAHQWQEFRDQEAVKFDIVLLFGGKERVNGSITALTNSTKARIDYNNGQSLIYDGDKVYAIDAENEGSKRFAAYTWPYFFLFPYKLSDDGTKWTAFEQTTLNDKSYKTQKLSFEAGTGDDPNDWYIAYANPENNLVEVAAYIVTAGKTQEEAEEDPHAISYHDYKEVNGIPIAHAWKFWGWRTDAGLTNQLGEATITNVRFVPVTEDLFAKPDGYVQL